MKFTVSEKKKHSEVEKDLIEYWKENGTFQKSIDQRPKENAWVFYDGPPFITGLPHHGNLSTSVIKDSVSRYYAMQSWLDTYVNEEFGVTREWIERFWADKAGDDKEVLAWKLEHEKMNFLVATDNNGELIARSSQIVLPNGVQLVRTMYIDKRFHGSGLADMLMKAMIDWFDNAKPIELGVTTFNQRAKNFYKKWGFEEIEGSEGIKFEKLPEIRMIRKPINNKGEK